MGQIKHQSDQCRDGSALKSWLDGLWGWLFLAGVFILPFIVLVVVSVPWRVANYKQGAMNRARASLLSALADPPPPHRLPSQYILECGARARPAMALIPRNGECHGWFRSSR